MSARDEGWDAIRERIAEIVADSIVKTISENPDAPLSKVGFNVALAVEMKRIWPKILFNDAVRDLNDYIGVPHGTEGYVWTASAAREVVREYVSDFGETP